MARKKIIVDEAPAWIKKLVNEWIALMILYRHAGNKIEYRKIKEQVDNFIADQDLVADSVFFVHGDPDDPQIRDEVVRKAKAAIGIKE